MTLQIQNKFNVVVVGVGGIGSYLSEIMVRSFSPIINKIDLVDKDVIEYKNLFRQPFGVKDIGKSKTAAVAERLKIFGLSVEINPLNEWFTYDTFREKMEKTLPQQYPTFILVGVDNHTARLEVLKVVDATKNTYCIIGANSTDSSNTYFYSKTLCNTRYDPRVRFPSMFDFDYDNPMSGCTAVSTVKSFPQTTLANFNAAADIATLFRVYTQNFEFIKSCDSSIIPYELVVHSVGKETQYYEKNFKLVEND